MRPAIAAVLFCIVAVLVGAVNEEEALTSLTDNGLSASAFGAGGNDLGEGKVRDSSTSGVNKKTWYRIPYFVLTHLSENAGNMNEESCKTTCEQKPQCRSFSWKQGSEECLWSLDAIHFDPEFDFFAKTNPETGAPFTYYEFLGVKYQESKDSKKFTKVSSAACRAKCDAEPTTCMSFSYRARDETCFLSGEGLHYDAKWTYYERDVASIPKDWKVGSTKEVASKKQYRGTPTKMSKGDIKEKEQEELKKSTATKASADAKVETLKERLAAAKDDLDTASTSADKEVAKMEEQKIQGDLDKAEKIQASAKLQMAAVEKESGTKPDDGKESVEEIDAEAKADANEAAETAKASHDAAKYAETTAAVSDSLMQAKEDAKTAQTAAKKATQEKSSADAEKDADAAKAAAAKAVEAAANAEKGMASADPKAKAKVATVANAAEKAAEAAAAAAAAAEVKSHLDQTMKALSSKKAREKVAKREHSALSSMVKVAELGLKNAPDDLAIKSAEKRAATKSIVSEKEEKDSNAQLAESKAKHAEVKQDHDMKQANANENAAKLAVERSAKKLSAMKEEKAKAKHKATTVPSELEKKALLKEITKLSDGVDKAQEDEAISKEVAKKRGLSQAVAEKQEGLYKKNVAERTKARKKADEKKSKAERLDGDKSDDEEQDEDDGASEEHDKTKAKEDASKAGEAKKFRDEAIDEQTEVTTKVKKAQEAYDQSEVAAKTSAAAASKANAQENEMEKQKEKAGKFKMSAQLAGEKEIAKQKLGAARRAQSQAKTAAKLAADNSESSMQSSEMASKKLNQLRKEKASIDAKVSVLKQTDIEAEKKAKKEGDEFIKNQQSEKKKKMNAKDGALLAAQHVLVMSQKAQQEKIVLSKGSAEEKAARKEMNTAETAEEKIVKKVKQARTMNDALAAGEILKEKRYKANEAKLKWSVKNAVVVQAKKKMDRYLKAVAEAKAYDKIKEQRKEQLIKKKANGMHLHLAAEEAKAQDKLLSAEEVERLAQEKEAKAGAAKLKLQALKAKLASGVQMGEKQANELKKKIANTDLELSLVRAKHKLALRAKSTEAVQKKLGKFSSATGKMQGQLLKDEDMAKKDALSEEQRENAAMSSVERAQEKKEKVAMMASSASAEVTELRGDYQDAFDMERSAKKDFQRIDVQERQDKAAAGKRDAAALRVQSALHLIKSSRGAEAAAKATVKLIEAKQAAVVLETRRAEAKENIMTTPAGKAEAGKEQAAAKAQATTLAEELKKEHKKDRKTAKNLIKGKRDLKRFHEELTIAEKEAAASKIEEAEWQKAEKFEQHTTAALHKSLSKLEAQEKKEGVIISREDRLAATKARKVSKDQKLKMQENEKMSKDQDKVAGDKHKLDRLLSVKDRIKFADERATKRSDSAKNGVQQYEKLIKNKKKMGLGKQLRNVEGKLKGEEEEEGAAATSEAEAAIIKQEDTDVANELQRKKERDTEEVETDKEKLLSDNDREKRTEQRQKNGVKEGKEEAETLHKENGVKLTAEKNRKDGVLTKKERTDKRVADFEDEAAKDEAKKTKAKMRAVESLRKAAVQKAVSEKMEEQVKEKRKALKDARRLVNEATAALSKSDAASQMQKTKVDSLESDLTKVKADAQIAKDASATAHTALEKATRNDEKAQADWKEAEAALTMIEKEGIKVKTALSLAAAAVQSAESKCAFNSKQRELGESAGVSGDCPEADAANKALAKAKADHAAHEEKLKAAEAAETTANDKERSTKQAMRHAKREKEEIMRRAGVVETGSGEIAENLKTETSAAAEAKVALAVDNKKHDTAQKVLEKAKLVLAKAEAEKKKTQAMAIQAEEEALKLQDEEDLLAQKLQEKKDREDRAKERAKDYEVQQLTRAAQKLSDEKQEKKQEAAALLAQQSFKVSTEKKQIAELEQTVVTSKIEKDEADAAFQKLDVAAAGMKAKAHLANEEMADAKVKETREKKEEAKTSVGTGAAKALFQRSQTEAEKVSKVAELTKKRKEDLAVQKEIEEKKFDEVGGEKAKAEAKEKISVKEGEESAAAAKLKTAEDARRVVDQKVIDTKLKEKDTKVVTKRAAEKAKEAVEKFEEMEKKLATLTKTISETTEPRDQLALNVKKANMEKNEVKPAKDTKEKLIGEAKSAEKKADDQGRQSMAIIEEQGKARENVAKIEMDELSKKTDLKNAKSEKELKKQAKKELDAFGEKVKEGDMKRRAAKILMNKAQELEVKKAKAEKDVLSKDAQAKELDQKQQKKIEASKKDLGKVKEFNKNMGVASEFQQKKAAFARKEERLREEVAEKLVRNKEALEKSDEAAAQSKLQEQTAKRKLKEAEETANKEKLARAAREKKKKKDIAEELKRSAKFTKEIEDKLKAFSDKADESRSKREKNDELYRENEAQSEKADKHFRRSERQKERVFKDAKRKTAVFDEQKELANKKFQKAAATVSEYKMDEIDAKKGIAEQVKTERTIKQAVISASTAEKRSKNLSDSRLTRIREVADKADKARKADLERAQAMRDKAQQELAKVDGGEFVPATEDRAKRMAWGELRKAESALRMYQADLEKVRNDLSNANADVAKANLRDKVKAATTKVDEKQAEVKKLQSKYDSATEKLQAAISNKRKAILKEIEQKKEQAKAAASEAEISTKESKKKAERIQTENAMNQVLTQEKSTKDKKAVEKMKVLEGRKARLENTLSGAVANREREEKNHSDKETAANNEHKKYAAGKEAAIAEVVTAQQSVAVAKAQSDKIAQVKAEVTEQEDTDREKRDKMAKRAERALSKNNGILDRLREKKEKDREYVTQEKNRKVARMAKMKEENTFKEGRSKKHEKDTKLLVAEADKKAAVRKAQEAAKKDLEAARLKEIATKKKVKAEKNMKKAVRMQVSAVDKAKMFRISLDEAKSEKDIKTASIRLAGAKSLETRAKTAMKTGGADLEDLVSKEHNFMEAKEMSDEALREAAKQMKQNQEKDGKVEEQKKAQAAESIEKEKAVEANGKEKVHKNNLKLKETETKMEKQKEEEEEKVKAQKEEVRKKVESRLAEEQEKQDKHDKAQKEIWDKGKARRAERAEKANTREAKEKAEEDKEKERTRKFEDKHREVNSKELELQEYRRERREKESAVKTEAKNMGENKKSLNMKMTQLAADLKEAKADHNTDKNSLGSALNAEKEKGNKLKGGAGKVAKAESDRALVEKAAKTLETNENASIKGEKEKADQKFSLADKYMKESSETKFTKEKTEKSVEEQDDLSKKLTKEVRTTNSASERTKALAAEKGAKVKAKELQGKIEIHAGEEEKTKMNVKEAQKQAALAQKSVKESKQKIADSKERVSDEDAKIIEAKKQRSLLQTAEFQAKQDKKKRQVEVDESETSMEHMEETKSELTTKYRIASDKFTMLTKQAEEKKLKHERSQKTSHAEEKNEKAQDKKERMSKAGEQKEKEASIKEKESEMKSNQQKREAKKAAEKEEKELGDSEKAKKGDLKANEQMLKKIASEGRGTEAAENAMKQGEKIEKAMEKAAKDKEGKVKAMHAKRESVNKKALEGIQKSKDDLKAQLAKITKRKDEAKASQLSVQDMINQAKQDQDGSAAKLSHYKRILDDLTKVDKNRQKELEKAKKQKELHDQANESAERKVARAQKEIESAKDNASWEKAKEAKKDAESTASEIGTKEQTYKSKLKEAEANSEISLGEEKTGKSKHQGAEADSSASEQKVKSLESKLSTFESTEKEANKALDAAKVEQKNHEAEYNERIKKEKGHKADMDRRLKEALAEKQDKEGMAKERAKETDAKAAEKKTKAAESTAKKLEKDNKAAAAEKVTKEREKKKVWAEQQEKEKEMKESNTKEKKKKAECDAKRELEQMQIRFTLAQDRSIEHGAGWVNFGNGYEGLRVQKQGNLCVLSGIVRIGKAMITKGTDLGKKFWHAEMESLIQTGEGAGNTPDVTGSASKSWGCPTATPTHGCAIAIVGAQCRPHGSVTLLANNHEMTSTVTINDKGYVYWKGGGSGHGWISFSGLVYFASGPGGLDGVIGLNAPPGKEGQGENNAKVQQEKVVFLSGWKASGEVTAYKQGNTCFLVGRAIPGFSSAKFSGAIMSLPKMCIPKTNMQFAFAFGKDTFRMDMKTNGQLTFPEGGQVLSDELKKNIKEGEGIDLSSVLFSTAAGKEILLHTDKGWLPKEGMTPKAVRQGSMCILSGVAKNDEIRSGEHSLLQNSGSPGELPEWCLPRQRLIFTTITEGGAPQRIDVQPTGIIRWIAGKRTKEVNLAGIRFEVRADIVQKYSGELLKVSECEA